MLVRGAVAKKSRVPNGAIFSNVFSVRWLCASPVPDLRGVAVPLRQCSEFSDPARVWFHPRLSVRTGRPPTLIRALIDRGIDRGLQLIVQYYPLDRAARALISRAALRYIG